VSICAYGFPEIFKAVVFGNFFAFVQEFKNTLNTNRKLWSVLFH